MKNTKIKTMCFTAMFAAMVFGLTMLHIPIGAGGYIHVGDALIYIVTLLMGVGVSFSGNRCGCCRYCFGLCSLCNSVNDYKNAYCRSVLPRI